MKPAEFWELHPEEFHWLVEAKQPQKMYGSLTEEEVSQIYEETYGWPQQ